MSYPSTLRLLTVSGLLFPGSGLFSQNISVNTTGAANSTSSMFEVLQPAGAASNSVGIFARNASTAANAYAIWAEATAAATNKYAIVVPSGGGKVGIGTSTPSALLNVADAAGFDVGPWITLEGGSNVYSNTGLRFWDKGTDLNNENVIEFGHNSTFVSAARIKSLNPAVNATTGGRLYLETASNNTGTYNTNQLVLNNNGNVGIGIAAAADKLDVNGGNIKITNGADYNGMLYSGDVNWGFRVQRTAATDDYNVRMSYYPTSGTRKAGIYNANLGNWVFYADQNATPNIIMTNITNVGIGTTSPGYKLTVASGAIGGNFGLTPNYANWSAYGTGDGGAAIYNDNAGYQKLMIVGNTSGGGGIRRIGMWDYLTLNGSGDITGTLAVGRTTLQAGAQVHVNSNLVVGDLAAGTNQTLEVIPGGGDVYIGSATQEGDLFVRNMAGTGNVHFSGGAFSSHYILNGYFGLGTSTPGNQLTVTGSAVFGGTSGTSGEPIEVRGALSGVAHKDRDGTSTRWVHYASGGLMRLWNDANGDRMVVTTAGDVGIGTGAPGHRLHVVPSGDNVCMAASCATGYLQFLPGNTGNGSYNNIVADDDNAIIFGYSAAAGAALSIAPWQGATTGIRINCPTGATALVGINRRATTNALEVSGDASKTTATAWLANSDRRIKTDIQGLDNAVATIMKLRPVKFKYSEEWKKRNPEIDPNRYYYNFIAQEYKEVFPESVKGSREYLENDPAEILQIDTYNSQIVAIKAIQEQQLMIDQLKEENKMLKEELSKTRNENDRRLKKLEEHMGMTAEK